MPDLPIALSVLCVATSFCRDLRIALVAVVLLVNWAFNSGMVWLTNDPNCWQLFLCTDYVSALIILIIGQHITRWQVAIIALFSLMIAVHTAYAMGAQGEWDKYRYWYRLYYLAWAQIAVIGAWGADERLCIRDGIVNAIQYLGARGKALTRRQK